MTSTQVSPMTATPGGQPRAIDWGRIAMVPFSALFGLLAARRLLDLVSGGDDSGLRLLSSLATVAMTGVFYALILWAYLRRGRARATARAPLALIAGPVATFLPFSLPFISSGDAPTAAVLMGDVLLGVGLAWSVWSLRALDRSLSMVPQARELVEHGPYAVVRHPLYLGELTAMLGLCLALGGFVPLLVWVLLVALQCYRAVQEELLLESALPGYEAYRARTARVLPRVF